MRYKYQAMDCTGLVTNNTIEANSNDEAVEKIRQLGLFVTRIDPIAADPKIIDIPRELQTLADRSRRITEKVNESKRRLTISKITLLIAALNCAFSLYGMFIRNHYISAISLPISAFVCIYGVYSIRKSRQITREIREISNESTTPNGPS